MTKQEEQYFDALTQDREENALMLEKPSMRGIKDSVVEKYSDQAHFVYELLQNADDAHASVARFVLEPSRLIFAHNGTRLFSISDPANEEDDTATGKLGDINAITSIANSSKTTASIGKFGVGFKAVFQYTSTPEIADPNFHFKIERFIVPVRLPGDFSGRADHETLFVFPFDHVQRSAFEAYTDIQNKLVSLSYPLLFLSNLQRIELMFDGKNGRYGKEIRKSYTFWNITADYICLTQEIDGKSEDDTMWLFSQEDDNHHRIAVGFFTNEEGKLIPSNEPAFCFFPTKEVTELNFIIHAPFLLTDSREGIRAGVQHNDNMISRLADLAAQSILLLKQIGDKESKRMIQDDILEIIPYNPDKFSSVQDKSKISFRPFYDAIHKVFSTEEILPSTDGYVSKKNAYWASAAPMTKLFSNEQLTFICDNKQAKWAFPSISRDNEQTANDARFAYINSITRTFLSDDSIISGRRKDLYYNRSIHVYQPLDPIKGIDGKFIEEQPVEWLHRFYKWLSESKSRTKAIKQKAIFLNQDKRATPAYDENNQLILFLPVKDVPGYNEVFHELLDNENTANFLKEIGIQQPSLRDQIYNIIIPQYTSKNAINTDPHFKIFFEYYCQCPHEESDEYLQLIKNLKFVKFYCHKDSKVYREAANTMYMPTEKLLRYFEPMPQTKFIAFDKYVTIVGEKKKDKLIEFLKALGLKTEPASKEIIETQYKHKATYTVIEGLDELIHDVVNNISKENSQYLWEQLCDFEEKGVLFSALQKECMCRRDGRYKWKPEKDKSKDTELAVLLKSSKWLYDTDDHIVQPTDISADKLSTIYDFTRDGAKMLIEHLGITCEESDSNLSDEQKEWFKSLKEFTSKGYNLEELEAFLEYKRRQEDRAKNAHKGIEATSVRDVGIDIDGLMADDPAEDEASIKRQGDVSTRSVVRDIIARTNDNKTQEMAEDEKIDDMDYDDYTPVPVNYSKHIEWAKQKSAKEIERIAYIEALQRRALSMAKYTFGWFNVLLEMECLNSNEANRYRKEVSIGFAKVEREKGTARSLVLRYPNTHIPQFIEDLTDIPLEFQYREKKRTLLIEVANVKSYTLHVKIKSGIHIDDINFDEILYATINAKSPAFLLDELRKQFMALQYEEDYDMQKNLCENITFIFGPPGTGKTTYLAKNIITPLMEEQGVMRVLVLTPTNKSADVLVKKIMDVSRETCAYQKWLVRFGATGDELIETSGVLKDRMFDIEALQKCVTVTTIARFPYDYFMQPGKQEVLLSEMHWDYIIIDEASMIPIANIVYPLYKSSPKKFIIAGDPHQIQPITSVNLWKDENIYTLVQLNSFVNPKTVPYAYQVILLQTQYRSIPEIGEIFSQFAYGGILRHFRSSISQKPLHLNNNFNIGTLNIIKYPVSKYESIYRAQRLQHSSAYQIYSAIFTSEYVCFLAKAIADANPKAHFTIGVIAPYRAQADLIDKLISSATCPKEVDVQVDTIHGFQGDECDIIFTVLNTPPAISTSGEMFLNNTNILNVSMSRAKDYLFIILPDDDTENIQNLKYVKQIEAIMKKTGCSKEAFAHDIEKTMFGDENYIENNVFSTGHQSVNVYSLPEKHYEVRTEDNAVDIQIYRGVNESGRESTTDDEKLHPIAQSEGEPEEKQEAGNPSSTSDDSVTQITVKGKLNGTYGLIHYDGDLKEQTARSLKKMNFELMLFGKRTNVLIDVDIERRLIYITNGRYEMAIKNVQNPLKVV